MNIIEEAKGKINFNLFVGEKRADGYHDIDTVMHTVGLCDTVRLYDSDTLSFGIIVGKAPRMEENIMFHAAKLFFEKTGVRGGVHLELAKHIPLESGMGGGSSNAAAVLRGLNRMYDTKVPLDTLALWGEELGADVPFFLYGGCARCEGKGEKVTPLPLWKGLPLVIIQPTVSIRTEEAYRRIDEATFERKNTTDDVVRAVKTQSVEALAGAMVNDFEILFHEEPFIGERGKDMKLYGKPYRMTGSGSAYFLIATSGEEAGRLADRWKEEHPSDFVVTTETR